MFLYLEIHGCFRGVIELALTADEKIRLRKQIRSNILEKTNIKNKELAEEIARQWASIK